MNKRIMLVIAVIIVLGVALFLVTAKESSRHKPQVMAPPSAP